MLSAALLAVCCGEPTTSSRFVTDLGDADGDAGPSPSAAAHWQYRSFDVDVDFDLSSFRSETDCYTTARLRINRADATPALHLLDPTPCDTLELTTTADILLYRTETDIDWSAQKLRVDQGQEQIRLGPVTNASGTSFALVLSEGPCTAHPACLCAIVERRGGAEQARFEIDPCEP